MHGLVNRSIQCFVEDGYGRDVWIAICRDGAIGFDDFEAMLIYDSAATDAILSAATSHLNRSRASLLEDIGTYLVTHTKSNGLRRLLRFGGADFTEFLHSIDDLKDRAQLALPDLEFPDLELKEYSPMSFCLHYRWHHRRFGALALGILRAMADDYGALVLLEHSPGQDEDGDNDQISIDLLDVEFAEGRVFELGASA